MFYVNEWWYRTVGKGLPDVPDHKEEASLDNAVVIFFHSEAKDEDDRKGVLQKLVKNVKWIAGKFGTRNVVFHSFNHLGMSRSSPQFAISVLDEAEERLERTGYRVMRTPFGYFNEFRIHVAGDSLAKVYKEF